MNSYQMAPTICVAEFPMVGTTVNTFVHRRRRSQNGININKRQPFALEQMIIGTIIKTSRENSLRKLEHSNMISNCSIPDKNKQPTNTNEYYKKLVTHPRKDLLSIIIRTIILVHRNRILQRRLNALRAETRRFLRSVLNNPENQCQERISQIQAHENENEIVSSTTEKVVSSLSPSFDSNSNKNLFHEAIFTCNNRDHTNDESNLNNLEIQAEKKFEANNFSDDA